jgi:hypothetical protein
MGIEPTNLLHAMQILDRPGRIFGLFRLANVMFCSFEKPVRDKGFIVHFASLGPGLSFVPPSVARARTEG